MTEALNGDLQLSEVINALSVHDHVSLIYETPKQQFASAIPFFQRGLERGEKCFYVADDNTITNLFQTMQAGGVDVNASVKKGALTVESKGLASLKSGYFNPEQMVHFWAENVGEAKAAGFPALRIVGEMAWALGGDVGPERLIEYEARMNRFFNDYDALGVCQYNTQRFSTETILQVLRTHPLVIYGSRVCKNPYYVPPDEFLKPYQKEVEVQRWLDNIRKYEQVERELRQLSGRLLRSQDAERRKIARDLHDSTGQVLVVLAATLAQLRQVVPSTNRKARRLISESEALADQCIREIRTLAYLLHPPMLDESGLEDAIRHYVEGFAKRSGISVKLELSPDLGRLPREFELSLFRVVQESLTNIQRHSGSRQARIRIVRDAKRVILEISDKGRKIPRGGLKSARGFTSGVGVGIPSMYERVQQVGGRLEIDSDGVGTIIRVTVPRNG